MDNKKTNEKKSLFSNRKFKYGSLSVSMAVLFLVLVVVLNVVVYSLAYAYGWYIDLTGEKYFGITEKSEKYLDEVLTEDVQIKIIFCQERDRVIDDSAGYYVYKAAETYKKSYPNNIKVEYLDILSNPDLAGIYTSQLGGKLSLNSVIIESNKTSSLRVLTYDSFYTYDSTTGNVFAFNGEMRFTSNILGLVTDNPICYFTIGHGEKLIDDSGHLTGLYQMMVDAGFDVRTIDLTLEEIEGNAKAIIINNPIYDFKGTGSEVNEISKISKFMSDNRGNMMVFLSPEHQGNLRNLKEWLTEWGISIESGQVVDNMNSLSQDGTSVVGQYPTDTGFAPSLHLSLRQLNSTPMTIVKNPIAITPLWTESRNAREVGSVLNSFSSSVLSKMSGEKFTGSYSIMSLVRQTKYDSVTQDSLRNYLLVTSAGYADSVYIDSNSYGNRDILFSLVTQMGKTLVPTDIDFKVVASEELAITTAQAYGWTVTLVAVMPLVVCGIGIFVNIRRKRR